MAHSYRTARERNQAAARIARDRFGAVVFPRVTAHPPRPGDVHPIERNVLLKLLPTLPLRFIHGLKEIELRARESAEVGQPYGAYHPRFRLIRLYSTPFPDWPAMVDEINPKSILGLCQATLGERDGQRILTWPSRMSLALYFFTRTFAHELGHHHVYQYRHKRSLPGSLRGHEDRADALAWQLRGWARFRAAFGDAA